MANVVTMCRQLAAISARRQPAHWQEMALQDLPTQIMEALGIRWAEGPEINWEHLITEDRLEYQLSFGCYRRRAFREPGERDAG